MQYDIKRFLDGGYSNLSDYASGLHITFESEAEGWDFMKELKYLYPNVALGALDFPDAPFYSAKDGIGYVYYKIDSRILRTMAVNECVPAENIIPASDLLVPVFDIKEMMNFIITGD